LSFLIGGYIAPPQWYIVSPSHSHASEEIAGYIREQYGRVPVIMTEMEWESTYIPLYFPGIADKYTIISYFLNDSQLKEYLELTRPQVLITKDGDEEQLARLEYIFATSFSEEVPDLTLQSTFYWNLDYRPEIRIYNIKHLYSDKTSK
jgi:hypothetical protein